jgi:monoamine oxidase
MRLPYSRLHRRFGTRRTASERREQIDRRIRSLETPKREPTQEARSRTGLAPDVRPHVCIVGAGFAGLTAGYGLSEQCKVTVLEARGRVGGRVWTITMNGQMIEAGGELIGYNHPRWLELAHTFGLGLAMFSTDDSFEALQLDTPYFLDGERISDNRARSIYTEMTDVFQMMSFKAKELIANPHKPWLANGAKELDATSLSHWIDNLSVKPHTKRALHDQFRNDGGIQTGKQSLLGILAAVRGGGIGGRIDDYFTQTETLRCANGNQALACSLSEAITKNGGIIQKNAPVTEINIADSNATLTMASGEQMTADYVVLAIPPSLLPGQPGATVAISPPLGDDYRMSMGSAVKYLSPVKRRFWIDKKLAPAGTSSRLGVTWEGTDNQITAHEPCLNLFAGGRPAERALKAFEQGGMSAVQEFYDTRLDRMYPGYSQNRLPTPRFIDWPNDKWTMGAYACPAPGEVTRTARLFSEPFRNRLYFAGEHTCPAFYGFMEAALRSGDRVARAIRRRLPRA